MTEVEIARELYDRIRKDSNYTLSPYRTVYFIARMMKRDEFAVLHAIGLLRVHTDNLNYDSNYPKTRGATKGHAWGEKDPYEELI